MTVSARGAGTRRAAAILAGDCYYEHRVARGEAAAPLRGDSSADVVVIGAGSAGLHCALELAERGERVVLLEAGRIGAAASGRNGGQVLPGFSADLDAFEVDLGALGARAAWDMSLEGMDIVRTRAGLDQSECCELRDGWVMFAARQTHVATLRAWHQQLERRLDYGPWVSFVDRSDLGNWTSAQGYHGALIDRRAFHLNPLKLMLAMARRCQALGVTIHENTAVTSILPGQSTWVASEQGRVRCERVVVAANVFVDGLGLPMARRIMPVGNSMIATEVLSPALAQALMREGYAGCDTNFMLDYFRVSADQRLIFGGASSYLRHDPKRGARTLHKKMVARFPELGGKRVDFAWGGLIDVTASRTPDFGRLGARIFYLQGFSGHGLNVSAIGARVVAEAMHGAPERLALFERLRHRAFPDSAVLRRTLLSMGTWYYRLRDQLG